MCLLSLCQVFSNNILNTLFKYVFENIFSICTCIFRQAKYDEDPDLNLGVTVNLLDNSAAKHKLSIKPKKNHLSQQQLHRSVSPQPQPHTTPSSNTQFAENMYVHSHNTRILINIYNSEFTSHWIKFYLGSNHLWKLLCTLFKQINSCQLNNYLCASFQLVE